MLIKTRLPSLWTKYLADSMKKYLLKIRYTAHGPAISLIQGVIVVLFDKLRHLNPLSVKLDGWNLLLGASVGLTIVTANACITTGLFNTLPSRGGAFLVTGILWEACAGTSLSNLGENETGDNSENKSRLHGDGDIAWCTLFGSYIYTFLRLHVYR